MSAAAIPLKFQVGARTLCSVGRRLRRVPLSLEAALAGPVASLPPLLDAEQGYIVTSFPVGETIATQGLLVHIRQSYRRFYVDLAAGKAAWWAGLSGNARSQLRRKDKKLRAAGAKVRCYVTAEELAEFHPLARAISARTYQERLLGSGLPDDPGPLVALAAEDGVRAWLLWMQERPIAYLCCTGEGDTLRYDHVGHLPEAASRAPGTVLQMAALVDLFAEARWQRFDFTEGEGQHKRQLATGGVDCVDLLLLRPTLANRALLTAMRGFDGALARAKRIRWLRRFRR